MGAARLALEPVVPPRTFTLKLGPLVRNVSGTNIASGALLGIMGMASVYNGLTSSAMAGLSGWQAWLSLKLQGLGRSFNEGLGWMPNWIAIGILALLLVLLTRRALRSRTHEPATSQTDKEVRHEQHCS